MTAHEALRKDTFFVKPAHSIDLKRFKKPDGTNFNACFICDLCGRAPLDPVASPHCGTAFCKECISHWMRKSSNCPDASCQECSEGKFDIAPAAYVTNHYAEAIIQCINISAGCEVKILFGKDGASCKKHLTECLYELVVCSDCKMHVYRGALAAHRESADHKRRITDAIFRSGEDVITKIKTLHMETEAIDRRVLELKVKNLEESNAPWAFLSHEVKQWSKLEMKEIDEIYLGKQTKKICHRIFKKMDSHTVISGRKFWFGIEKGLDGIIGFFLRCEPTVPVRPLTILFQLVVRKRGAPTFAYKGEFSQMTFLTQLAWGHENFITESALRTLGGYHPDEDIIDFGVSFCLAPTQEWPST
ncbi:MAG: hypothetical protein Harvfovirus17_16 [Harvfovirus sp.]|uniref:RING-type domain-containing protein n=1 Tax=Harvfovirus sp. TaxID=2487768 RepID=A0A3G5A1Q1_9VIRU|nr:MAG: hypothetical protein Harvfovirus17_16 [Harvfovirus sp.]